MSSYYSSSILSSYLRDSESTASTTDLTPAGEKRHRVPQIHVSHARSDPNNDGGDESGMLATAPADTQESGSFGADRPPANQPNDPFGLIPDRSVSGSSDAQSLSGIHSVHSGVSDISGVTSQSMYSSVSEDSEDMDLQSVQLQFKSIGLEPKKKGLFKRLGRKEQQPELTDEERFFAHVQAVLQSEYYSYPKSTTLKVDWAQAAEVFFFGDTLDKLFTTDHLLDYLTSSSFELGEVRFSNLHKFHRDEIHNIPQLLTALQPELDQFNGVLDLYAESEKNMQRPELFEIFSKYANHSDGLCLPLATAMFGHWLLTYNRDSSIANNYDNPLILDHFRKGARLALALRRVASEMDTAAQDFDKNTYFGISKYWGKDNISALAISMHGLGEYYQYVHQHDLAVTLWEMNCHLTEDRESGNLAILGLANGYGFGNRVKERNRLGKRSKTNKFNTKRRIAQLYRVLMKDPKFDEYGVSWATKEKYD